MSTLELKLDEQASIFVEVQTPAGRREDVSSVDSKIEESFDKVSGSLKKIAEAMERQLASMTRRPDKVQLEMGAQLKGNADLWLVAGEATAHMKITLAWDKPAST